MKQTIVTNCPGRRENTVRIPTGTLVTACALSAALLTAVAGCGGNDDNATKAGGELFLQPVAAQGPDPFTASTVTTTATPSPVTRSPQPAQSGSTAVRSVSGGTPGLYSGTERAGSCDVERQIGHLTADQAKARAFAQAEGISQASVPSYLRSLASVVLRADTRVTNHGYSGGRATSYQSVLQAGTAVLVDNRGVPRVRCACGNPLGPPVAMRGGAGTSGRPWSGYRPTQVIVVAPTVQVITNITIINIVNNTWIERRIGHDVRHDHIVPKPSPVTPTPTPTPSPDGSESSASASTSASTSERPPASASASEESDSPQTPETDCATPTVTITPGVTDDTTTGTPSTDVTDCPTVTVTATPPTTVPEEPTEQEPEGVPESGIGPETVPDTPDLSDGGGLIPDEPAGTDSIFDSPTDVFGS
ncbi:DUF6777 domain-containing protein [Streptomyces fulvoviolaceus]|uniref:DUF6777 domain-containing protein n=1 Tax=Streptomyces fulvoviolaceus TaxID=285535 RepID=UPI001F413D9B|nr:DUF6777 domain-containing protein [Streptomyces fulvoviolaceus]